MTGAVQSSVDRRQELSWVLGGPQGGGINASAELFARALARGGLWVFANIEFHSNIMGKHSYYRVTAAPAAIHSHLDTIDMLVALDEETLFGDAPQRKQYPSHTGHVHEVVAGGGIVYDADLKIDQTRFKRQDVQLYPIPYLEVLEQALTSLGRPGQARKHIVMRNTVALGASIGLIGYDEALVEAIIRESFKGRKAEAADINVAVGAAHMGVRAATSTAGPGFALMSEGIGFAAITEAPGPVVFLWQRGGPSTGLPTRSEQADLQFALHPAHGDFPHLVVAPGDLEEAFYHSFESFNWADRYQIPVLVLLDKFLASSFFTVGKIDLSRLRIVRGLLYQPATPERDGYRGHALTANGVSPRSVPGTAGATFSTTSDEHDPQGHITEGVENRI